MVKNITSVSDVSSKSGDDGGKENGKVYSHSRLWLYESCPEFYKLKYIAKKVPPMQTHISLFLGSVVHEALEWLYHQVKYHEITIDELIEYFTERWTSQFGENIRIENGDEVDAYNKAVKFLVDYYTKHRPFKENVLAIERKIIFPLDVEKKYFIQGYIDRLDLASDGTYEVHDYKTNAYPKKQIEVDNDRQLAFYHIGLKEIFGNDIKVNLIWHFLSHNLQMVSQRSEESLEKLKIETLNLIKEIESAIEWPACKGRYCDWCNYKNTNGITYEDAVRMFDDVKKAEEMKKIASTGQKFLS